MNRRPGPVVPQGPRIVQDLGQQARRGLDAEIVVQHQERRAGALVRHAGLDQRVNRHQVRRRVVGGALNIALGDQAAGAMGDHVD